MKTLQVDLTDKEWQHVLRQRRYEVGEELSECEIKKSVETDLRNVLLTEWYPERWIIQ